MTVESIKVQIDALANERYEDGWKDCRNHYAKLPLESARVEHLTLRCNELARQNRLQARRLSLAVKLLRLAQASECGQLGQYNRFFEEGYEVGFEEDV